MDELRFDDGIWIFDFEYRDNGCSPIPSVVVARELRTGETVRKAVASAPAGEAPFPVGDGAVTIAYSAMGDLQCFRALGWPLPTHVIDIMVEHRVLTGQRLAALYTACRYWGIEIQGDDAHKQRMRELAMRGPPFEQLEWNELLDYCETDVLNLARLVEAIWKRLDLVAAIHRGRFVRAFADIARRGIPVNAAAYRHLKSRWSDIRREITEILAGHTGIYEGGHLNLARLQEWAATQGISWPRTASGRAATDGSTLKQLAERYPQVESILETLSAVGKMDLFDLTLGPDGRNRCFIELFATVTGRNQASTARWIYSLGGWARFLIRPRPGHVVITTDWSAQEILIAAALSNDQRMLEAYYASDVYIAFAIMAGAAPPQATKHTHPEIRNRYKICLLSVLYGAGAVGVSERLGCSREEGVILINQFRRAFPAFCAFGERVRDAAMTGKPIYTALGWPLRLGHTPNPRSIVNWPIQSTGAEMMRLATIASVEDGIPLVATVHDSLVAEEIQSRAAETTARLQHHMNQACALLLDGHVARTDTSIVEYPNSCGDPKGQNLWNLIWRAADRVADRPAS